MTPLPLELKLRQAKYWFGLGIIMVALVFVIKLRARLESYLAMVKVQSQYNYSYVSYRSYLQRVSVRLTAKASENLPELDPLALALAQGRWTLPQLVNELKNEVAKVCRAECDAIWYQMLLERSRAFAAEIDFNGPDPDFVQQLDQDLATQIQLLMPDNATLPVHFILQEKSPLVNKGIQLNDTQKQLLLFFDPHYFSLSYDAQGRILKNIWHEDQMQPATGDFAELSAFLDWLHFNRLRGATNMTALLMEYSALANQFPNFHKRHFASMSEFRLKIGQEPNDSYIPLIRPLGYDELGELTLLVR